MGIGIGSGCAAWPKEASRKDLVNGRKKTAERGSRTRIPSYVELWNESEDVFREEICGQPDQKSYGASLSDYEDSGARKVLAEEIGIGQITEWCVSAEHCPME